MLWTLMCQKWHSNTRTQTFVCVCCCFYLFFLEEGGPDPLVQRQKMNWLTVATLWEKTRLPLLTCVQFDGLPSVGRTDVALRVRTGPSWSTLWQHQHICKISLTMTTMINQQTKQTNTNVVLSWYQMHNKGHKTHRPETPTIIFTWHASKCDADKIHPGNILKDDVANKNNHRR